MCCSSRQRLQLQGLNNDISRAAIKPGQQQQKDVFAFAGAAAVSIDRAQSHLPLSLPLSLSPSLLRTRQFLLVAGNSSVKSFLFAFCRFRNKNPQSSRVVFVFILPLRHLRCGQRIRLFLFVCNKFADKRRIIAGSCRYPCSSLPACACLPAEQDASYILRRYCLRIS